MATETKRGGIFYGWWVVIGCFMAYAISAIGVYIIGIFFPFIGPEMGWTRADLGFVLTAEFWVTTAAGFLAGWMVDRFGGRITIFLGALICGTGLVLMSTMTSLTQMLIYYSVLCGLGIALQSIGPTAAVARKWFFKRAGLATGIISAGFGVVGAIGIPILASTAASIGWRPTLLWAAIITEALVAIYAILVIRDTPEKIGTYPDGDAAAAEERAKVMQAMAGREAMGLGEAVRAPQFWFLLLGMSFLAIQTPSLLGHLGMIAVGLGVAPAASGLYMTYWLIPSILGRIGGGWLGDRIGKKRTAQLAGVVACALFIFAWLAVKSPTMLIVFLVLAGAFMIAPIVVIPPLLGDLFGVRNLGTILGLMMLIQGIAMSFGPTIFGAIAEAQGSYSMGFALFAGLYLVGVLFISFVRPTRLGVPVR